MKPEDDATWVKGKCIWCGRFTDILFDYPDETAIDYCINCLNASIRSSEEFESRRGEFHD